MTETTLHPQVIRRSATLELGWTAPGALYLLALMGLVLTIWTPGFFTAANLTNVVLQVAVLTIVALGMTLVILTEGIDLSLGPVLGLCGVVAGLMVTTGYSLLARRRGGTRHRRGAGVAQRIADRGRRDATLHRDAGHVRDRAEHRHGAHPGRLGGSPAGLLPLVQRRRLRRRLPVPIWATIAAFVVTWILLYRTKFGRYVFAIGGNRQRARPLGNARQRLSRRRLRLCRPARGRRLLHHDGTHERRAPDDRRRARVRRDRGGDPRRHLVRERPRRRSPAP